MANPRGGGDYSIVTEHAGIHVTPGAVDRLRARYAFAGQFAADRRVLEVGCGAGPGLGYLRARARFVVGGDCTESLLGQAKAACSPPPALVRLDGERLPFAVDSFDVVVLHEVLYYLRDADAFAVEARRVLAPGGHLVVCSVNPEWTGFHASPYSTRYHSAAELSALLGRHFTRVDVHGAFTPDAGIRGACVALARRVASAARLMPATMKGKERLKRFFYGPLVPFPATLTPDDQMRLPRLEAPATKQHTVLFALASVS